MFDTPRLEALLQEHPGGPALIEFLLDELAAFTGSEWEQEDDVTMVTLSRASYLQRHKHKQTTNSKPMVGLGLTHPLVSDNILAPLIS